MSSTEDRDYCTEIVPLGFVNTPECITVAAQVEVAFVEQISDQILPKHSDDISLCDDARGLARNSDEV